MIITIDGYAGSGKSTAARRLAESLGYSRLNTGAMYRAVGLIFARSGIDAFASQPDIEAMAAAVKLLHFDMPGDRVLVNSEDLTALLRTEELGAAASKVGTFPVVRAHLKAEQRRIADRRNIVCEGRDQGTAVFPDAPVKFFLRASVEVRAHRRMRELEARGEKVDGATIHKQISDRDRQDETRAIDPLRQAPDAVVLDTSHMTEEEVLHAMREVILRHSSRA